MDLFANTRRAVIGASGGEGRLVEQLDARAIGLECNVERRDLLTFPKGHHPVVGSEEDAARPLHHDFRAKTFKQRLVRNEILPRVNKKDKERSLGQDRTQGRLLNTGPIEACVTRRLVDGSSATVHTCSHSEGRRIAIGLRAALIVLAVFVGWAAAWLEDQPASQSTNPSHSGVITAGVFGAGFCVGRPSEVKPCGY